MVVYSNYLDQVADVWGVACAGGDAASISGMKLFAPQAHLLMPCTVCLTFVTSQEMLLFRFLVF